MAKVHHLSEVADRIKNMLKQGLLDSKTAMILLGKDSVPASTASSATPVAPEPSAPKESDTRNDPQKRPIAEVEPTPPSEAELDDLLEQAKKAKNETHIELVYTHTYMFQVF